MRFKSIDCIQADELLSSEDMVIIDVRDQEAFDTGHIIGAIRLAVSELDVFCNQTEKNKPVMVYCYHGISSQSVAQFMVDQGMENVYSLTGGFEVWKEQHNTAGDS